MTLDPLLQAPAVIQLHGAAALLSVVLGPVAIFRRSRDILHRTAGRVWVVCMAITAGSSFWISEDPMLGPFSVIHILSALTLVGPVSAVRATRAGDVVRHGATMRALHAQALMLAGAFTFLPSGAADERGLLSRHALAGPCGDAGRCGGCAVAALAQRAQKPLPFPWGLR